INGGNLMKPQIVKEIRNSGGIVKSFYPQVVNKVISENTSTTMRNILERVVADPNGTGKNAYIKGYRIGGKTGTSEKGRNNGKRIASFVGFAPADDPQIICLVMLDEPQVANKYGGTIAAPLVGSIIEETLEYMGIDRQYTEAEAQSVSVSVPDVREQSVTSAKEMVAAKGLNIKVSGNGEVVLDQLPKPGVSVAENSTVIVYTQERDENKKVAVPNLEGLTAEQAKKRLSDAGLNFEVGGAGLAAAEGAYAFRQSIPAGTLVEPATVVSVEFRHSSSD
nr:PASTA domain-containing protein [Bacillota bacterium]